VEGEQRQCVEQFSRAVDENVERQARIVRRRPPDRTRQLGEHELAGDEVGRTQGGNNNAYCQDNEISWIDWTPEHMDRDTLGFVQQLIALHKAAGFSKSDVDVAEKVYEKAAASGDKNADMLNVHKRDPHAYETLARALAAPSLYDEVLRLLSRRGYGIPEEYLSRDFSEPYRASKQVAGAWLGVYHNADKGWDLYELAERLVDLDHNFQLWRCHHLKTVERIIGTLGGAVWAIVVSVSLPHSNVLLAGVALTVALAPLAVVAALWPEYRVAPVTAVIVLLGSFEQREGTPIFALHRVLEIGLGCVVAFGVAFIMPAPAHGFLIKAAKRVLDHLATQTSVLFAGLLEPVDSASARALHDIVPLSQVRHEFDSCFTRVTEQEGIRRGIYPCAPAPQIGGGRNGAKATPTVRFVGSGAILLGGIRVGGGATVGAGAVVTRDVPPGATVAPLPD